MNYQWMQERRKELRLSQEELANRLQAEGWDISRSSVSAWEQGYNNPPVDKEGFLTVLSTVFKMSVPEILAAFGYQTSVEATSPEIIRATELMRKLPSNAQKEALEHIEIVSRRFFTLEG